MEYDDSWYMFRCNNCGWSTPGTFNWNKRPEWSDALPDTDCPKCGYHDSVNDMGDEVIPVPQNIAVVVADIHSGPFTIGAVRGTTVVAEIS